MAEKMAVKLKEEHLLPEIHYGMSFVYSRLKSNYSRSLYYAILRKKGNEAIGAANLADDFTIMMEYAYMGSKTKVEKLLENLKPKIISGAYTIPTMSQATLIGLIGESYLKTNQLDSALKFGLWSLGIPEKNKWPYLYFVLAQTYLEKKDYKESLKFVYAGMKPIKAIRREKNIAQLYACAANDYYELNNLDSAIHYANLSNRLGVKNSISDVILNSSQLLFKIYKQQNKYDSAFKYLQAASAIKDTIAQQNKINDIENISMNESIREQEKIEQENQKNNLTLGFSLFFILSFSGLYFYNKNKQKASIRKIEDERKNKELKAAQDLQKSFLPKLIPQRADLDIATFIRSSTEVGGDYYDFISRSDGELISICGDATGHGVASGMMVSVTKTALNGLGPLQPHQMLANLNSVIKKVDLGILRMSLNVVEFGSNELRCSSAAMPPIYLYCAKDGQLEELANNGLPLGSLRDEKYALEKREFHHGDILIQFSDGLPEAPNVSGEPYDYERMKNLVQRSCHLSASEIIDVLIESVDEWLGGQLNPDDITLVVTKNIG
jgi:serine phosphatase RsbU (regulator of sigma subunit)